MTRSQALLMANALIKRCKSISLIVTATPKGSKGSLGRGERANLTIQGQLRAFREAVSMRYQTEIGPEHVLMGWMVPHSAWVVDNFQVKGTGRTPYRSIRSKDYTGEVVPFRRWSQFEHEMDARSFCRQA